ncbi:9870_t:CDS:2, partial [Rhizophagus irregularis]
SAKIITPTENNSSLSSNEDSFLLSIYEHIDMALLCHVNIKKELKFLASELQKETLPTFYTDGSVKFIGNTRCLNGYGWIQCQPNTPQV